MTPIFQRCSPTIVTQPFIRLTYIEIVERFRVIPVKRLELLQSGGLTIDDVDRQVRGLSMHDGIVAKFYPTRHIGENKNAQCRPGSNRQPPVVPPPADCQSDHADRQRPADMPQLRDERETNAHDHNQDEDMSQRKLRRSLEGGSGNFIRCLTSCYQA